MADPENTCKSEERDRSVLDAYQAFKESLRKEHNLRAILVMAEAMQALADGMIYESFAMLAEAAEYVKAAKALEQDASLWPAIYRTVPEVVPKRRILRHQPSRRRASLVRQRLIGWAPPQRPLRPHRYPTTPQET